MNLRLLGIIGTVLTVLLAVDGIYMLVSHYNGNETQGTLNLLDGTTVLIEAGLLLIATIIAFIMSARRANAEGIVPTPVASEVDTTSDVQRTETVG